MSLQRNPSKLVPIVGQRKVHACSQRHHLHIATTGAEIRIDAAAGGAQANPPGEDADGESASAGAATASFAAASSGSRSFSGDASGRLNSGSKTSSGSGGFGDGDASGGAPRSGLEIAAGESCLSPVIPTWTTSTQGLQH